jgi:hypothetical protein
MSWLITGRQVDAADPDARAYLAAVEAADTQALEPAVRLAVDAFVVGCKADGIWNAIKASCIMAGARTRLGAMVPMVGAAPTSFNFANDDYNRKTGLKGNGTTKYLNANRNNNADPQDSNHAAVYASAVGTPSTSKNRVFIAGGGAASAGTNLLTQGAFIDGRLFTRNRSSAGTDSGVAVAAGFVGMSRGSSSAYTTRTNGTNYNVAVVSDGLLSSNTLVFSRDGTSGDSGGTTDARLAFYSIGESLDLALLDTRVTTLINAIAAAIP